MNTNYLQKLSELEEWREPPKIMQQSPPPYLVEFPLEESNPTNENSILKTEDENDLSLTMFNGLILVKKRKEVVTTTTTHRGICDQQENNNIRD